MYTVQSSLTLSWSLATFRYTSSDVKIGVLKMEVLEQRKKTLIEWTQIQT